MDMQQLFAAAQQMQDQLMNAQQALADAEVTGTAGGGLVKATVNGQGELLDLSISPAAVDTDDGTNPLTTTPAFAEFVRDIADRCEEGPAASPASLVGSYRLF